MQLPRGTLHSVKKDIQPSTLFKDISVQKFTGHCNLYSSSGTASIIFKEGRCILAETGQFYGFDAYKRIEMDPFTFTAELYTFSEMQIELSSEFNAKCTVVFPKKIPLPEKKDGMHAVPESRVMAEVKRQQLSEDGIKPTSPKETSTPFDFRASVNPKIRKPKSDFQLPRGKFVSLQKSVSLLNVLTIAEENNFSGYIIIDTGIRKASIIYRNGMCIMIDYPPTYGEDAIKEIQKDLGKDVTAELYDLSHQQMDLALEFNDGYWANNWTKKTGVLIRPASRDTIGEKPKDSGEIVKEEARKPDLKPDIKKPSSPDRTTTPIKPKAEELADIPDDEEDEFAKQVRTLESMDMGLMESRVRENFRDVIKELDLEYLLINEKTEKKGTET
ncbi:MAG: hypothetical protein WC346_09025 [Methanogenium sp.]|jgi:hypothetical protein